jgi:two-component system phosphate regulon response regulator OmpR
MLGPSQGRAEGPATDGGPKGGSEAPRILVVDDEPELRRVLAEYLAKHGFAVRTAAGGAELDTLLGEQAADLLILDINMPGENGISIARRVRAGGHVPILMLTAADEVVDRVVGLEIGADDYVTKPFDLRELLARIRAVLRRAERAGGPAPATPSAAPPRTAPARSVRFGRAVLDLDARCLFQDDGEPMELTAMEFDLLHVFAQNPNRVLTRDRLLELAHNRDWEPFDRSIDVRIARIRRKVEHDPAKPQVIRTMRGAGYMFVPAKP